MAEMRTDWFDATFQSMYGTPIAFSTMQSAAMGGYGVGNVNGFVQGFAAAVGGITEAFRWLGKIGTTT